MKFSKDFTPHQQEASAGRPWRNARNPRKEITLRPRLEGRGAGFTLIELAIVLFLVAVAAAVSLPSVGRGIETLRIRSEAGSIVALLRHGRQQAITKYRSQVITFNPTTHTFSLTEEGSETAQVVRPFSKELRVLPDPPSQTSITFSPQGFSSGGSFLLEGPGNRRYRVTVDPMTGRVTNTKLG